MIDYKPLLISAIAATFIALAGEASAQAGIPDVVWERLPDGPDLALHTMIHDPLADALWIFGGVTANPCGTNLHNNLWRLDLDEEDARWQLVTVQGLRPPPLVFHTAIYDPIRHEMIVYGGTDKLEGCFGARPQDPKNVWRLDLDDEDAPTWTRDSVAGNGAPRFGHAAVYVPKADAMVVSGGFSGPQSGNLRDDNWALYMGEEPRRWQRLANAGFTQRAGHGLVHDAEGEQLLAYGGFNANQRAINLLDALPIANGLTDADQWVRLRPTNPSQPRSFFASALDVERGLWWMQGGFLANNSFLRDLQVLDISGDDLTWTNTRTVYNGPLERFLHPAVWDATRLRMFTHGGTPDNNRTLRDTRAMVYEGVAEASPTAGDTNTATVTSSPTAMSSQTESASPTAGTVTATATSQDAGSPTPTDVTNLTATATDAGTPTTSAPTMTPSTTTVSIHLPLALNNGGLRVD